MFTVTDNARNQLAKTLAESDAVAIKVALKKSGCSGFMYYLDFCKELDESLVVLEKEPLTLVAEEENLPYLKNVTLDYVKEGLNRAFRFSNPDAKAECGCGESFLF